MRSALAPLTVLVRPRATFVRLAERPRLIWLFALVLLLVTLLAKLAVGMPHVLELQEQAMRDANVGVTVTAEESDSGDGGGKIRTPEDAQRDGEAGSGDDEVVVPEGVQDAARTVTMIGSYVFGTLGLVVGTLVLSGVVYGASRMWSKETPFAAVLGVVALAKMPDAVRNVVQTVYTAASGNWVQHQGLGALAAPAKVTDAPSVAYAVLSMIDVYAIWFVVLLFLGMRLAIGLERRRAGILIGSFAAVGVVFAVVPALLASAFMPV